MPTAQAVGFLVVGEMLLIQTNLWDTVVNVAIVVTPKRKAFSYNVQWIGQCGLFGLGGSSWNQ